MRLLPVFGLFGGTLFMLALPFVPAVMELVRKKDGKPLFVDQNDEGDVKHFSKTFGKLIDTRLATAVREAKASGLPYEGTLPDGGPYLVVPATNEGAITAAEHNAHSVGKVLVLCAPFALPEKIVFTKELFSESTVWGGAECVYRAILSRSSLFLAKNSVVLRWAHAADRIQVEEGCQLLGRTSADGSIRLAAGCKFMRVHAPVVEFGQPQGAAQRLGPDLQPDGKGALEHPEMAVKRWLVHGNLELPPETSYEGNLVVRGWIRIGAGSHMRGSIKSHGDLLIDQGVRVDGSIVSTKTIRLSPDCVVRGPVIAEDRVVIESGAVIGGETAPTTITAPKIIAQTGAKAFGSVWASVGGRVEERS